MKNILSRATIALAVIALAALISTSHPGALSAQSSGLGSGITGLRGFAWSSFLDSDVIGPTDDERKGGSGWVSFSSTDPNANSSAAYGVTFDPFTGALGGDAWSSNYGWLSFDRGITGNPPGSASDDPGAGTGPIAVKINNRLVGWARFINACQDDLWDSQHGRCTGPGAGIANGVMSQGDTDGQYWDGWVSLSKKSNDTIDYGLTVDPATGVVGGYAWGGPTNVGWINFHQDNTPDHCTTEPCVIVTSTPLTAQCSVTSAGGTISASNPQVSATWTSAIVGGTAPYTVSWVDQSNSEIGGVTTPSVTTSYASGGVKTAQVRVTDSATPNAVVASNICSVTIGIDAVNPPTSCTIPANASLCNGSADNQGAASTPLSSRLNDNGSCPTGTVGACVFQCNADYVRRGGSCVKKSSVIEK